MRTTNFAKANNSPVGWVATILWALVLILALTLFLTVREAQRLTVVGNLLASQSEKAEREVAGLQLDQAELPARAEIMALRGDIDFFNGLLEVGQTGLPPVLEELEGILPDNVRLAKLRFGAVEALTAMALQSDDDTALPPVLIGIEQSARFEDVVLERQIRVQEGAASRIQFDIRARVK